MLDLFSQRKQDKIKKEAAKKRLPVEIYLQSIYANRAAKYGYSNVTEYLTARHDAKKIKRRKENQEISTSSTSSNDSD